MLEIKIKYEIALSDNYGTEKDRWVSVESLKPMLTKFRTLTTEEIIVEIEYLIKQLKEGK